MVEVASSGEWRPNKFGLEYLREIDEFGKEEKVLSSLSTHFFLLFISWFFMNRIKMIKKVNKGETNMQLGAFSISLSVKDIQKSKQFYEKLGFEQFAGDIDMNYLIMKNGDHLIGLFQGMFEKNILTFNPGWNQNAEKMKSFTDVRELQKQLKAKGVEFDTEVDESADGPGSFVVVDPDGNPILVDQHV